MTLASKVKVSPRFQKAIRIDVDGGDAAMLSGYHCPTSSAEILKAMARHIEGGQQAAFTWTGPYGSGKSSLALALASLVSGDDAGVAAAKKSLKSSRGTAEKIISAFRCREQQWNVVPVIGHRGSLAPSFGSALTNAKIARGVKGRTWTDPIIIETLDRYLRKNPGNSILLLVDEMGKFLEASAQQSADVYLFQLLAELASRSNRRLVIVGILHQSFDEYANKLSRAARDEWIKIQGRFSDFPLNSTGDEQIELLGRAIVSSKPPAEADRLCSTAASIITKQRGEKSSNALSHLLCSCWPLHPVVTCLLGPISRRRFGQNQRSIFAFLNSPEPLGFQDYLDTAELDSLYQPHQLWDYLCSNLEPAILSSSDGHRWAIASEAVHRAETLSDDEVHAKLAKTIAIIDLFRDRSGISASEEVLKLCFKEIPDKELSSLLDDLKKWSLVVYKKHLGSYATFAGSDFDLEAALADEEERANSRPTTERLSKLIRLQPIVAKRHFAETGAMRWLDVKLIEADNLVTFGKNPSLSKGAMGVFALAIASGNQSVKKVETLAKEAAKLSLAETDIVVGVSARSWRIPQLVSRLDAIESVKKNRPELAGDAVARREVQAAEDEMRAELDEDLRSVLQGATWHSKSNEPAQLNQFELSQLASSLADHRYPNSPIIRNELANREHPSSSAVGAINALLRAMVNGQSLDRLGLEGFSAEAGLYDSVVAASGLHRSRKDSWAFIDPVDHPERKNNLQSLWKFTRAVLEEHSDENISAKDIYSLWQKPPFGVKSGLCPILFTAFMLSNRGTLAIYREGVFQPVLSELDIDYLSRDPIDISVRKMNLDAASNKLLAKLAETADSFSSIAVDPSEPFSVARGLVNAYEILPAWTRRTNRISRQAVQVREILKRANDPNKLIFQDIPQLIESTIHEKNLGAVAKYVADGISELSEAYPIMLDHLWAKLLSELRVSPGPASFSELKARAENIRQVSGDFRLEAFVGRLTCATQADRELTATLASLAINKPAENWIDPDIDRLAIELSELCKRFAHAEQYAHVKGRPNKRNAFALVIGKDGTHEPLLQEFDITEREEAEAEQLAIRLNQLLTDSKVSSADVAISALAKASEKHIRRSIDTKSGNPKSEQAELHL